MVPSVCKTPSLHHNVIIIILYIVGMSITWTCMSQKLAWCKHLPCVALYSLSSTNISIITLHHHHPKYECANCQICQSECVVTNLLMRTQHRFCMFYCLMEHFELSKPRVAVCFLSKVQVIHKSLLANSIILNLSKQRHWPYKFLDFHVHVYINFQKRRIWVNSHPWTFPL